MQFALVNGERVRPSPGLRGICPVCENITISHCGQINIWHWKHKSKTDCNANKGKETEWHLNWKNRFPVEWQEVVIIDESGEKHQADILRPEDKFCIEIQHSPISEAEIQSRNKAYGNIAWIVDGSRLKTDFEKFEHVKSNISGDGILGISKISLKVISFWEENTKPVFIDFRDLNKYEKRRVFYFYRTKKNRFLFEIAVEDFVSGVKTKGGLKLIVKKAQKSFERLIEFKLREQGIRKIGEKFYTSYGGGEIVRLSSMDAKSKQTGWNVSLDFLFFDNQIEKYYEKIKIGKIFARNKVSKFCCIKKEYVSSLKMIELIVINTESKDYFLVKISLEGEGKLLHDFRAMHETSKGIV